MIKSNLKIIIILLLFTSISFSQRAIVAGGNQNETFGEVIPLMQQIDTTVVEVSLGLPTHQIPELPKKEVVKKKSLFQKIIEAISNLFRKK